MPPANHWQRQVWRWRGVDLFGLQEAATLHDGGTVRRQPPSPLVSPCQATAALPLVSVRLNVKGDRLTTPTSATPLVIHGKVFPVGRHSQELPIQLSCLR